MPKTIIAAFLASLAMSVAAIAGEAQGSIVSTDATAMTVTLDNNETYALPADFDITLIGRGMVVALAYNDDDAAKTVTDMELLD